MDLLQILRPIKVPWHKIRMGSSDDGGYVVTENVLEWSDELVSFGIGWDYQFELEYHRLTGNEVVMTDPMPRNDFWSEDLIYIQGYGEHFPQTLWTLFKCDVEGDEYHIFDDWWPEEGFILDQFESRQRPMEMVVEWHDVGERLEDFMVLHLDILHTHSVFHVHGNNYGGTFEHDGHLVPNVLEISYVNNQLLPDGPIKYDRNPYPTPLDYPNDPTQPDLLLTWINPSNHT